MTVRMLTNVAGSPSFHSGEVVELKDEIAKAWIADGLAAAHRDEKPAERATRS